MLLGKRQRPAIQRTASMSGVTFDLNAGDSQPPPPLDFLNQPYHYPTTNFSPRNMISRRRSADFLETPPFLESCRLCTRRLVPGRDVYMYRGDSAFCSQECRQQQIIQDERKEKKCSMATKKAAAGASAAAGSKPATTGETVAAV